MSNSKVSYQCPKCHEILVFDRLYENLIGAIDITCPVCNDTSKGETLLESHADKSAKEETKNTPKNTENISAYSFISGLEIKENYIDERGTKGEAGDFYEVKGTRCTIGRKSDSSKADIQIPSNRYMSRMHMAITREDESKFYIEWIGSTNPAKVNGKALDAESRLLLNNGDEITLGQCVAIWKAIPVHKDKSILL